MLARNIFGFCVGSGMRRMMTVHGFHASIMKTDREIGDEIKGLPPGMPIPVMPVDALKNRPDFWIGGPGSFVCPVESDWALWFNWTMNKVSEIAVLTSVKGMNPITGQRIEGLGLEQYRTQCPVHKIDFKHGLFCSECNFKWPEQNYYSKPNPMYCDGFRLPDGTVRQFYFTEDMVKSVPEQVIGRDDTVPAFGFCFYGMKEVFSGYEDGNRLKNEFPKESRSGGGIAMAASMLSPLRESLDYPSLKKSTRSLNAEVRKSLDYPSLKKSTRSLNAEVGIGAGAKISQRFSKDSRPLNFWTKDPIIIRVYFVFREQFESYAASGFHDLIGSKEGYLDNVVVGGYDE